MYSILYADIIRESVKADSFILISYLLNFSGNYIVPQEKEKYQNEQHKLSRDVVVQELAKLVNRVDSDTSDLFVLTSGEIEVLQEFLNDAKEQFYVDRDIEVMSVQHKLGYSTRLSVFDMYTLNFGGGRVCTTLEMIDALIVSRFREVLKHKYNQGSGIVIVHLRRFSEEEYALSFSWGILTSGYKYNSVGTLSGSVNLGSEIYLYSFNQLLLELITNLARSGFSLYNTVWVCSSQGIWGEFEKLSRLCQFSRLSDVPLCFLTDILKDIPLMKILGGIEPYQALLGVFLGGRVSADWGRAASVIGSIFERYSELLKLTVSDDTLVVSHPEYLHDFSLIMPGEMNLNRAKYFMLLDCEGTVQGGATEVGGLIVAVNDGQLIKLGSFNFDRFDFESSFADMLNTWQELTGRKVVRGITFYTYGSNDETMFMQALRNEMGRKNKRKYFNYLKFLDCQPVIFKLLEELGINEGRRLSSVARALGVSTVMPKHSALNDAKTLFNILSVGFLLKGDDFLDDIK